MSPVPHDPHRRDPDCPAAEVELAFLHLERELRAVSLDLWIAGWPPDELHDHVRRSIADRRAGDLLSLVLLVDDSLRSEWARPPDWCTPIDRLRAVTGVTIDDLRPGWLARWARANSVYETSRAAAELLLDLRATLTDLVCPLLDERAGPLR